MSLLIISLLLLFDDPKAEPVKQLEWISSLAKGYVQSQDKHQGILLKVGGAGCAWCAKLDVEIATVSVQKELANWTLVSQDVSLHEQELKPFGIQGIPALRILSANGRTVATHDGYLTGDKLTAWLKKNREHAVQDISSELVEEDELTLPTVIKLLKTIQQRDSSFREAAIRRMLPFPEIAAVQAVDTFTSGNLQARLAIFELLTAWQAPLLDVDPWQPTTLTANKLKELQAWALTPKKNAEVIKALSVEQLHSVNLELQELLDADESQAVVIIERLARYGKAMQAQVYSQLKKITSDQHRERLTLLRYRLVSRDALALRWPNGLQRLAATSAATRHQAVQELAKRATAADEPLLLELFSDPDAMVREISLRTLHAVSGSKNNAALVNLLKDPEPNVRAAVLKQLSEKPSAQLIPSISEYITNEKDHDLVVHAVRVLRNAKGKKAAEALRTLFTHESWRVRAEAAEAIGEMHKNHQQSLNSEDTAENYTALLELLKDTDEFVISRATSTLKSANLPIVVEPLLNTARRHPELAPDIISSLSSSGLLQGKSVEVIRQFCKDKNEKIRIAALSGLIQMDLNGCEKEVKSGLQDTGSIRKAVCKAIRDQLTNKSNHHMPPFNEENSAIDSDEAVKKIRKLDSNPKWIQEVPQLVASMLKQGTPEEQLAAALLLITMGQEEPALSHIQKLVKEKPARLHEAAVVLNSLLWDKKIALFHEFVERSTQPEQLEEVVQQFSAMNDPRVLPILWDFVATSKCTNTMLASISYRLLPLYFGNNYYNPQSINDKKRNTVVEAVRPFIEKGPSSRQALALSICYYAKREVANELADKLLKDKSTPQDLKQDAATIYLLSLSKSKGREYAISLLTHNDPEYRKLGLEFLTLGANAISSIRGKQIHLSSHFGGEAVETFGRGSGQTVTVEPPKGLTAEMIKPLMKEKDPQTVVLAAYLLCTLGDKEGLPKLQSYWREHGRTDTDWQRLVYRAIAVAGSDEDIATIEEIYQIVHESGQDYYVSEMYWTIRGMEGPNALKLRKRIRQEIGMEQLR